MNLSNYDAWKLSNGENAVYGYHETAHRVSISEGEDSDIAAFVKAAVDCNYLEWTADGECDESLDAGCVEELQAIAHEHGVTLCVIDFVDGCIQY